MKKTEFDRWLKSIYSPDLFGDCAPNGLQLDGCKEHVCKIATAVTVSLDVIDIAIRNDVDTLIVHHGLFWYGQNSTLTGAFLKKVQKMLKSKMSLFAYHFPMDAHDLIGNNWSVVRDFGCVDIMSSGPKCNKGLPLGAIGRFPIPINSSDLIEKIKSYYGCCPRVASPDHDISISVLLVCSGGAHRYFCETIDCDVDAFVCGTGDEPQWHLARENNKLFVSVGHCLSEKIGPKLLAMKIEQELGIPSLFIDDRNPF